MIDLAGGSVKQDRDGAQRNNGIPLHHGNMALPKPVRTETLRQQIAKILQEAIFTGQLKPGQLLREQALGKQLGVSQATIREALAHLEQLGLVSKAVNRGTTVTNLSAREVRERLAVRVALEELAAAEAAVRMTEQDFDILVQLAERIARGIEANLYFETSQADIDFHRFIWEKSGNAILYRTLDQLTTPLFAFLGLLHKLTAQDQRATKPHSDIIQALRTRDAETVKDAIRGHIRGSYGVFLESDAEDLLTLVNGLS
ncbi:MAG: GntR family transcriptional regulator [Bryobacteraceae bacterium]|nr:MAG: GntR family transcriptional regulator [Bryobacteraceae bacterium]